MRIINENNNNFKFVDNRNGYRIYRAIVDGKGVWRAMNDKDDESDFSKLSFPITYDQARGFDSIGQPKDIDKLRKTLYKKLMVNEDNLNYLNSDMKKLRNAVRGIVVDNDKQFIDLVDNIINDEPINYVPETRKLKNAIDSVYVDSDEELRKLVLDVAVDQGVISRSINESKDILKDLSNITDYNRGFKDFDSLEKYLNSKGYEVADIGDDYIDIASPDGYRYSFDFDYSSEAPGGRLSIGSFIDRDKE